MYWTKLRQQQISIQLLEIPLWLQISFLSRFDLGTWLSIINSGIWIPWAPSHLDMGSRLSSDQWGRSRNNVHNLRIQSLKEIICSFFVLSYLRQHLHPFQTLVPPVDPYIMLQLPWGPSCSLALSIIFLPFPMAQWLDLGFPTSDKRFSIIKASSCWGRYF